ncbi:GFA family protein [Aestuariibacter halophilus]|uniref:GFA family protein n=1 Tax=Fluctibacter halophilus TaxID=226011 RepID=A0ABS8G6F1_9ALTE|nr:GFA family protein [Aestuariibacter halophilus]MCC2616162.1 GFA family protein [Aestuariibacter halophilus]
MKTPIQREARCLCGQLRVTVAGDPAVSLVCNCKNCQRRSGTPFGAITYFSDPQVVDISGTSHTYQFEVSNGNQNTLYFCPSCGATVMMKPQIFAGMTGIGMGCFSDPEFPEPTMSVWNRSKYRWVQHPDHWHHMAQQSPS